MRARAGVCVSSCEAAGKANKQKRLNEQTHANSIHILGNAFHFIYIIYLRAALILHLILALLHDYFYRLKAFLWLFSLSPSLSRSPNVCVLRVSHSCQCAINAFLSILFCFAYLFVHSLVQLEPRHHQFLHCLCALVAETTATRNNNNNNKKQNFYGCTFVCYSFMITTKWIAICSKLSHSNQCEWIVCARSMCMYICSHYSAAIVAACLPSSHAHCLYCVPCLWHNLDKHALAQPHSMCARSKVH